MLIGATDYNFMANRRDQWWVQKGNRKNGRTLCPVSHRHLFVLSGLKTNVDSSVTNKVNRFTLLLSTKALLWSERNTWMQNVDKPSNYSHHGVGGNSEFTLLGCGFNSVYRVKNKAAVCWKYVYFLLGTYSLLGTSKSSKCCLTVT